VIAVIPVRGGVLPLGAEEAAAEAGGVALLVGDGTQTAARELSTASSVECAEAKDYAPGRFAIALAPGLEPHDVVLLPASPDGRDLAPRLAHRLGRPLLAGATEVAPDRVVLIRQGGLIAEEHVITGPIVATLEPGARGTSPADQREWHGALAMSLAHADGHDAEVLEVVPPDPATMDLAEASRIVAGGAGLGGPEPFATLREVAASLGSSWGASRVAADAGWVPQDRFIGTTGVTVNARLYVALGISGAVQHVSGLGHPDRIIAVNTDASAPMMTMADLAIVTDARALLDALADRLGVENHD
jgi:electron transfer flavoprotein alpha subunit